MLSAVVAALAALAASLGSSASVPACAAPGGWLQASGTGSERVPGNEVLARAAAAEIVLLGEQHDEEDHHRWQAQVLSLIHI